jgi:hypothetical protein
MEWLEKRTAQNRRSDGLTMRDYVEANPIHSKVRLDNTRDDELNDLGFGPADSFPQNAPNRSWSSENKRPLDWKTGQASFPSVWEIDSMMATPHSSIHLWHGLI